MNSKWRKRLGAWAFLIVFVFQLTACQQVTGQSGTSDDGTASSYIFTMGTVFDIRVFADDADDVMQQAEQAINGCDKLLSWREKGSLAYKFNTEHQTDMSEIKEVLEDALRVSKDSQGTFDLTVLPLSQLWNFDRFGDSDFDVSTMEVPDQADIREAMKKVDYTQLRYNDETGILSTENTDIQIELGDIANILAYISIGDRIQDIERLVGALADIKRLYSKDPASMLNTEYINPKVLVSPQTAFYSEKTRLPIRETSGRICAEFVMCYPPGIPILAPGELITDEIIEYVLYAKEKGCSMQGTEDPAVEYLNVL